MSKLHVKKGDQVVVVTGKDKGKKGKILTALPSAGRVVVEDVNVVVRHKKARSMTDEGGRIEHAAPINASNVMLYCSKCDKGVRVSKQVKDGKKIRVCKKCGATL